METPDEITALRTLLAEALDRLAGTPPPAAEATPATASFRWRQNRRGPWRSEGDDGSAAGP
ncbi:hypothetical protein CKO38_17155 [Rhodospirillum rubrum]|uniref:hypothetical protein n=1 Tax=Rhodospirillum rubrum TaxID=1085 RepID=UPI0019080011|nr:hypothetical protein [Rhodospirillum rubrum]MBK1666215.1 hypothetical protein [Rhodospirillum rubrum]MBK1678365.1 hypothetical protein [Rhodospirillum rubrum]